IRELGLEKARDPLGRPRYVLPERGGRVKAEDALAAILAQFGRRATPAQNLVVLVSELGTAPAIARALDRVQHAKVVGTLAGDDTTIIVTRTAADARALERELSQHFGS